MFDTKMKAYLLFYFLVVNDSSKVLLLSSIIKGTTLIFISEKVVIFIFSGSYGGREERSIGTLAPLLRYLKETTIVTTTGLSKSNKFN